MTGVREPSPLPIGMAREPGTAFRRVRDGPVTEPPTSPLTGILIPDFGGALDNLGLAVQTRKGLAATQGADPCRAQLSCHQPHQLPPAGSSAISPPPSSPIARTE
jgi:hypothetical protein